jgi:Uma2 family endonuclease
MANAPPSTTLTTTDLADLFGPMPLSRFRFVPFPGTATEQDVINLHDHHDCLCELVDGILVEKAIGFRASVLAMVLARFLGDFVKARNLGALVGADGMMRLAPSVVRSSDVSFTCWDHIPGRRIPHEPIPELAPDLAVEVLRPSNTREEMRRKLRDYFGAGTRLVWFVDLDARTVTVYAAPDQATVLHEDQTLDGGAVLPGFSLPLRQLFAELDPQ